MNYALFHHERMDGSGYPFGLEGCKIHPYQQWISIFDMFDTLVAVTVPRCCRSRCWRFLYCGVGVIRHGQSMPSSQKHGVISPGDDGAS
ncbi:HD-GYP domain-containing protein [Cohnella luojiensis]|uniref:HD-GYP domain-containing protein n=1 Tax=Cohnella luojiensis TaxID=652876 RepID=A0A4Y8LQM5_9BACL|nr:hypothetical protein E2980_18595 [Cohnella luojiensis]